MTSAIVQPLGPRSCTREGTIIGALMCRRRARVVPQRLRSNEVKDNSEKLKGRGFDGRGRSGERVELDETPAQDLLQDLQTEAATAG